MSVKTKPAELTLREEHPRHSLPEPFRAGVVLRTQDTGHPSGFSASPAAAFSPRESALALQIVAAGLNLDVTRIYLLRQVHGAAVVRRSAEAARESGHGIDWRRPAADAQWSTDRGHALGVFVADCCPVVLVDPETGVHGIAHAGWRGTAAGVVARLWAEMHQGGARPESVHAWIGPCAGPNTYEVGSDVASLFTPQHPRAIATPPGMNGAVCLDLRSVLVEHVRACGISADRISVSPGDTITDLRYHSHRRDRLRAGRMLAYVANLNATQ